MPLISGCHHRPHTDAPPKAQAVARFGVALATLVTLAFVGPQTSQASSTADEKSDLYRGPREPIGHSLATPAAQERITMLLAAKLGTAVSDTPKYVSEELPPLVGGQYGFKAPEAFSGTPKALVNLHTSGSRYAIVVEKLHHRLSVFESQPGTQDITLVKTYRAITGKDPEDKFVRGDLRTPEGVYFVNGVLPDNSLPPKYGRLALTLDYPNIFDRRQKKSGYGIWIHATDDPKRLEKPFDTEGCVAVSNEDITELEQYIDEGVTPIVITKEMTTTRPDDHMRSRQAALKMLESWKTAWEQSLLEQYMTYYSDSFSHKHMDKAAWEAHKRRLARSRDASIEINLSEPTVVAFEDQLIINFLQEYKSNGHSDFGTKSLYMKWEKDRYRIISEQWRSVQKSETALQLLQPAEGQF